MPDQIPNAHSPSEFMAFFMQDSRRIFTYIYSLLPNRTDAEDVFQSTSITLWEKFDDFDQERDFYLWACGVAFYKVKNYRRVASRNRLSFSSELVASLAAQRQAGRSRCDIRLDAMEVCIEKLPQDDRLLLRQAYADVDGAGDMSRIQEAANQRGRAIQTIYNRLNSIRRRVVQCIDQATTPEGAGA